jgi:hypothetical protein
MTEERSAVGLGVSRESPTNPRRPAPDTAALEKIAHDAVNVLAQIADTLDMMPVDGCTHTLVLRAALLDAAEEMLGNVYKLVPRSVLEDHSEAGKAALARLDRHWRKTYHFPETGPLE